MALQSKTKNSVISRISPTYTSLYQLWVSNIPDGGDCLAPTILATLHHVDRARYLDLEPREVNRQAIYRVDGLCIQEMLQEVQEKG